MSLRKPKSSLPSVFDLPSKQLQLITVSAKPTQAPAYRQTWHEELPELRDRQPRAQKGRLH
jgi:hypothetical protein